MRGAGGITEAINSLISSAGVSLPPWAIPAVLVFAFLWLLPHIRQNQRTHKARKMIQERTTTGGAQSSEIHSEILSLAGGHPVTLVVIADEAHRRGLNDLARKALRTLERTGKRPADIRRLRNVIDGPAPIFPDAERDAILELASKGLTGLAQKKINRAKMHWPDLAIWTELEAQIMSEE